MGKVTDFSVVRALSDMVTRAKLATNFGHRFDGLRDYNTTFGYKTSLTYKDMLAKYNRQGIAARIVDAPAQALWDNPPIITSNNDEWNEAWDRIVTKNGLWETVLRLDKLAGLGRYSCMFIGTNSVGKPAKPVTKRKSTQSLSEILYLQVYSQGSADIDSINSDTNSPNYMLPEMYTLYPYRQNDGTVITKTSGSIPSIKAHSSRIIHVAENTLENQVYGAPRLERAFNDLDDMLKVSGGTAETYWLTANRGMQIDVDKDMDLNAEDAEDLNDEIEEYQHQLRRFLRTRGVTIKNLGSDVPSPAETFNMLISLLSGATGIPRRILIGAEAGQLASEQDRANWADRIKARRTDFGEPMVIYPLISRFTHMGVLPSSVDLEITVTWPDAFQLNPLEVAQKSAQHARSATNFASAIDKLEKLKRGTPGSPGMTDAEGNVIEGTEVAAEDGADYTDLIAVDWMKEQLGQTPTKPTLNDPEDLKANK